MSNDRATRDSMSIEEAMVSNMWELGKIIEIGQRLAKGTMH